MLEEFTIASPPPPSPRALPPVSALIGEKREREAAQAEEKSHQYAFSFEGDTAASCREAYGDAAGVLTHLANVDGPLKAVLDGPADLARLEVHGPQSEVHKLKEALSQLGCLFYVTDWGFRSAHPKA